VEVEERGLGIIHVGRIGWIEKGGVCRMLWGGTYPLSVINGARECRDASSERSKRGGVKKSKKDTKSQKDEVPEVDVVVVVTRGLGACYVPRADAGDFPDSAKKGGERGPTSVND